MATARAREAGQSGEPGRLHAVDHLKAAAIFAVVVIHSGSAGWPPRADTADYWLTLVWTQFGVPAFLFASGLLYARSSPVGWRAVGARLARVLVPYLVFSSAAQLAGVTRAKDWNDVAHQLLTASSLGIYYYVFLLVLCIPLIWPLSRMRREAVLALWIAFAAWTAAGAFFPALRVPLGPFWAARIPLADFMLGYFLGGWVVASWQPELGGLFARHRSACTGACAAAALYGLLVFAQVLPSAPQPFDRVAYTFGVVGLVAALGSARPAGPCVRFLGDASLGLFLLHRIFQLLVKPVTAGWPDPLRIAAQLVVGLAGASLVLLAGRRLLGPSRARRLLGA